LTLHESVGHATELDRVLGSEAAYAGTSFPGCERLGELEYGSSAMNVTGDRTAEHGLATIGYDDEGVAAQAWDIVRRGLLVGYQLDRATARRLGASRSNGCSFADSAVHVPMLRMANVSLQPAPGGPSTEELVSSVEHGLYVVGDESWSIDMQRLNFQFTGQRFYRIEHGRLAGQVRDAAYQSSTPAFWRALVAVGGPETYRLMGADHCGKGQPGQIAAASHGCPAALFRGIRVLDTGREA
jgi:TldD protein